MKNTATYPPKQPKPLSLSHTQDAKKLAESWGMNTHDQSPWVVMRDAQAQKIATGDGVALWWIDSRTQTSHQKLHAWTRRLSADSQLSAILICAELSPQKWITISCPRLGEQHILSRRWSEKNSDAQKRISEALINAGKHCNGIAEPLLFALEEVLNRKKTGDAFVKDFRRAWKKIADGWTNVPQNDAAARKHMALKVLSRLLFLSFLQARGWLDKRKNYLQSENEKHQKYTQNTYQTFLQPLFFGALNTPQEERTPEALVLGDIPYLNGGLFAEDPTEQQHPHRNLPNNLLSHTLEHLFSKYIFESTNPHRDDGDLWTLSPQMLGRVFEALMEPSQKSASGSFYTPQHVVQHILSESLTAWSRAQLEKDPIKDANHTKTTALINKTLNNKEKKPKTNNAKRGAALHKLFFENSPEQLDKHDAKRLDTLLHNIHILDPAAGSGAFIIGAFNLLLKVRITLAKYLKSTLQIDTLRRHIATQNLYGVDLLPQAIRLSELRLWLALSAQLNTDKHQEIPPLPNLDLHLRQGNSLLEPHDIDTLIHQHTPTPKHEQLQHSQHSQQLAHLQELHANYLESSGPEKARLSTQIETQETLLFQYIATRALNHLQTRLTALHKLADSPDLFGNPRGLHDEERHLHAQLQKQQINLQSSLEKLKKEESLPFFSFSLHFAEVMQNGGFDLIVGNPPWVRPHRQTPEQKQRLKRRYHVCNPNTWRHSTTAKYNAKLGGSLHTPQVDLANVFLERALQLLKPNGVTGMLIPSKLFLTMGSAGLRQLIHKQATPRAIIDWSKGHRRLFKAATFPAALILEKNPTTPRNTLIKRLQHNHWEHFRLPCKQLSLLKNNPSAPWALLPQTQRHHLRQMQLAGPPIGEKFHLRRGIFTGHNRAFLTQTTLPTTHPDHITARFNDDTEHTTLERALLRPAIRGRDLSPFSVTTNSTLIFPHHDDGTPLESIPPATAAHLQKYNDALLKRSELRPNQPHWTLFRVHKETLQPKVVWRDISKQLEAAFLPGKITHPTLGPQTPIPMNTVYYAPVPTQQDGYLLSALLNSKSARAFCDATAEPARGQYFRYFSSTVGTLPWPFDHLDEHARTKIENLSRQLHQHTPSKTPHHQTTNPKITNPKTTNPKTTNPKTTNPEITNPLELKKQLDHLIQQAYEHPKTQRRAA